VVHLQLLSRRKKNNSHKKVRLQYSATLHDLHTYIYIRTCMPVCMYACIHKHIHAYVHTILACMHTYVRTYIHTYILWVRRLVRMTIEYRRSHKNTKI
jgi:hypothetical protein